MSHATGTACVRAGERAPADSGLPPLRLAARRSDEQLRTLAYEVTVAEARERERIANGLHDEIGQVLAIVALKLAELARLAAAAQQQAMLDELRDLVAQAAQATRQATFDLSSPVLQQLGLQAAIESQAARVERAVGIPVAVAGTLPALPMSSQVAAVVFRAVRELLANLARHSGAGQAHIRLFADAQRLVIAVADDGRGFDTGTPRPGPGPQGGYGLASAEAQMQAIGGRLDIESARGCGTRATITLPLHAALGGD